MCKEGEFAFTPQGRKTNEIAEVRRDLVTATSAIAGLASLVFGLFTNLPIALA